MRDFDFELITLKGSDSKLLNQIQDLEKMTLQRVGKIYGLLGQWLNNNLLLLLSTKI